MPENNNKPGFDRQPMVGWFDAKQLAHTGLYAVISSLFGSFADKREMLAAVNPPKFDNDYSANKEVWIDYISDTGDGFDSTYTMATLVAKKSLKVEGVDKELPKPKVIIFGGDQVYPTASREEYTNRFTGPFSAASHAEDPDATEENHLYAVPGNHDWYDGLTNFGKLFFQSRSIGNWRTKQNRSYFAIKVTANTWIWAIDIQFEADIDYPQLQYFDELIMKMNKGDKVILCSAEPSWIYSGSRNGDVSYHNLCFFETRYFGDLKNPSYNASKQLELVVSLSGDLHHYSRYELKAPNGKSYHKITAGGGGAFMHPTHNLPEKIEKVREGDFDLKQRFPSQAESKKMLWGNIMFPISNKQFGSFMGMVYALFAWFVIISGEVGNNDLVKFIGNNGISMIGKVAKLFLLTFSVSPSSIIIIVALIFGFGAFCDTASTKKKWVGIVGYLHGACHVLLSLSLLWLFVYVNTNWLFPLIHNAAPSFKVTSHSWMLAATLLEMVIIGGYMGAVLMGTYLMICNRLLKIHDNEAYSSLKIEGWKNFMRMHFKDDVLTIYPVGLKRSARWKWNQTKFTTTDTLAPELIEQPIVINLK
ncbi:MAG: putative phosphohydrolase [Flavipsychrobacter sp.]|nr:putative phosphohydrolase [Flavipsychrobacter sp.]